MLLLMYKENVELLELGCQEALGALMFEQNINLKTYTGVDFDKRLISSPPIHTPPLYTGLYSDICTFPNVQHGIQEYHRAQG